LDENPKEHDKYVEEEAHIFYLLLILWKRKWAVIGICSACLAAGIYLSASTTEAYKVFVVIKPGVIDVTPEGRYIYLDEADNIKGKIMSNAYDQRLRSSFSSNKKWSRFQFNVNMPKGTSVLNISIVVPKDQIVFGIQLLNDLIRELQNDYSTDVERKKAQILKQSLLLKNEINQILMNRKDLEFRISQTKRINKQLTDQKNRYLASLDTLRAREKELLQEIPSLKKRTEKLMQSREQYPQDGTAAPVKGMEEILYSNTVHQHLFYLNELRSQLNDTRLQMDSVKGLIDGVEKSILDNQLSINYLELERNRQNHIQVENNKIELNDLEKKIAYIQNINMISQPSVDPKPVGPNRILFIVISVVMGLIVSIIFVFFAEYMAGLRQVKG